MVPLSFLQPALEAFFCTMINGRYPTSLEKSSNGNGSASYLSSSPSGHSTHILYSRSVSTPSPSASLPKAIPFARTNRSKSVYAPGGNLPPSSAPVTFNRYINVNSVATTPEQDSSPSSSWYARLSNSLKKSVLRRSISNRETTQKRIRGGPRRSVITLTVCFCFISTAEWGMGRRKNSNCLYGQLAGYYNLAAT